MKVYISTKKPENYEFIHVSNLMWLDNLVLDSEARVIVVDHFFQQFTIKEIPVVMEKILGKLRLGGELLIEETDMDVVSLKYYRGDLSLEEVNNTMFTDQSSIKSVFTVEMFRSLLSSLNIVIENLSLDNQAASFLVKARRQK
jgi:predicted SAM-dependent methyltransferase